MTISYKWLSEYLPVSLEPEQLSIILTSVGLEVESLERYEEVKGGLKGLVIGEILECTKHPNADKLSLTKVAIGKSVPLNIVCGAPNVAKGQKVIVAPVGTTLYPSKGEPLTMKVAKIRGSESEGMICAADELGLSDDHSGILVLPNDTTVGMPASEYFQPNEDWVFEIGLTPNRMDAMSHWGVARDICTYLSHHENNTYQPVLPQTVLPAKGKDQLPVKVTIENKSACQRYSGISISNVTVQESPQWLQQKLKAIGQRPINNIVDVTNFILHETGQPLHAFDLDAIKGREVVIKNLPQGTPFKTLDGKERSLHEQDLMICNGAGEPMCIAGVFGGQDSGVTSATTRIFLESAWFNPVDIRKTSFRHALRTDAALRFEKNRDISSTADVLTRATTLITSITGATLASDIIDVYPDPSPRKKLQLSYTFLNRLSGKYYEPEKVNRILQGLGFNLLSSGPESVEVEIPPHKPDISLQADLVEEIMRIDGLDNIAIPVTITLSPSIEKQGYRQVWKEKIAGTLAGIGFNEISTNSITNSAYFDEKALIGSVKLLNNLSAEHNLLRPSMLETGLEVMAHNINRKNNDLRLFEFGKTYHRSENRFEEMEHLCLYVTGLNNSIGWRAKPLPADLYYIKGVLESLLQIAGIKELEWTYSSLPKLQDSGTINLNGQPLASFGTVSREELKRFDIKQPVFFADIHWNQLLLIINERLLKYQEIPRQLPVYRDLAMVIPSDMAYENVEKTVKKLKLNKLKDMKLFDIFESDKLGKGKKSVAVNFMFLDPDTTLTDTEIEGMMNKLMQALEKELKAEIRKQ